MAELDLLCVERLRLAINMHMRLVDYRCVYVAVAIYKCIFIYP